LLNFIPRRLAALGARHVAAAVIYSKVKWKPMPHVSHVLHI
jgi:hypothetical protein